MLLLNQKLVTIEVKASPWLLLVPDILEYLLHQRAPPPCIRLDLNWLFFTVMDACPPSNLPMGRRFNVDEKSRVKAIRKSGWSGMTWVDDKVMSLGAKKEVAAQYNDRSEDFAGYDRLGENTWKQEDVTSTPIAL